MSKVPSLHLSLNIDTPLERAVELIDRHYGFLTPIGVELGGRKAGIVPEPNSSLMAGEVEIAGGRLSSLRNPVRFPWAEAVRDRRFGAEITCLHRIKMGPDGAEALVFRYTYGASWSTLTNLTVMRNGLGLSIHVILHHSGWYPLWDCPPLRAFDMDHWRMLLTGLHGAVGEAGRAVNHVAVNLGHYAFHEPWKSALFDLARNIPGAEVE